MTLTLVTKLPKGLNVCMNYEFNLLHHVGVVPKRLFAAASAETAAHEGTTIPLRAQRAEK